MNAPKVLLVTAILLGLGVATGYEAALRVGYLLIGLLIISLLWSWVGVSSLTITRDTRNRRAQVGQTVEEVVRAENLSIIPKLWVEVIDHSTLPEHHLSQSISLGSKGAQTWRARTACLRRGKYILGPIIVQSGDPFGLFIKRRRIADTRTLLVYPETMPLPELDMRVGLLPGGATMRHRVQYITPNVAGVRDYVSGDSFNRIHWRSTARWQKLMVKECELDPFSEMWIVLDMEARHHRGRGDDSTEEYAVRAAASLAQSFLEQNRSVGFSSYGPRRQVVAPDRGTRQLVKLLEELAITRATGSVSLAEIVTAEATRYGKNTTLVLITPSTSEDWVAALRKVMHSGVKAVGVVIDPASFGGQEDASWTINSLMADGVPVFIVKQGDTLDKALMGDGTNLAMPVLT